MRSRTPIKHGCISIALVAASILFFNDRVIVDSLRPVAYSVLKTVRQYDGCECQDCAARFVGITPRRHYGCCAPGPMTVFGLMTGVASFLVAGGFALSALSIAATRPSGHCARCNYDLTGLPFGVCPECGSSTAAD